MPVRLKDKVAVITGGGRGIGRDIALAYAREGAHVVVAEIDPQTAAATAKDAGGKSIGVAVDVAKSADINRLIDETIKSLRPRRHRRQQRHEDRARQAGSACRKRRGTPQ